MTQIVVVTQDNNTVVQQQQLESVVQELKSSVVVEVEATQTVVADRNSTNLITQETTETVVVEQKQSTFIVAGLLPPVTLANILNDTSNLDLSNLQDTSVLSYSSALQKWTANSILSDYATKTYVTTRGYLTSVSWSDVQNKPTFSQVATTGNYADLQNKPALFSGNYADLSNKPTIPTDTSQLTNGAGFITAVDSTLSEQAIIMAIALG